MGLDQYLFHIRKATDEDAAAMNGRRIEDVREKYAVFYGDEPHLIEPIKPWLKPITVRTDELDYDAIKSAHDVPLDARITGWCISPEGLSLSLRDTEDNPYRITLTEDEQKPFEIEIEREIYIAHDAEECGYWRKDYALSDDIDLVCPTENCGYYPVDEDMWSVIENHSGGLDTDYIPISDEECLAYHEWY